MWCWVPASLAWSNHCTRSCMCAFCGEDGVPLSSCYGTSLIPSNVLLDGLADSFFCFLYFFLSWEISLDQPVNKELINRNWILTRSGELCLLLPGVSNLLLVSGFASPCCRILLVLNDFNEKSCSSGKIHMPSNFRVCMEQLIHVFTNFFFTVIKPRDLSRGLDSLLIILALGAGGWRKMPCFAGLVKKLCASDTINLYSCVHFSCATVVKWELITHKPIGLFVL